jgi:hypothetical protein
VHDSSARRITTITPDILAPRSHEFPRGADCLTAPFHESSNNIRFGSPAVRVQIVNVDSAEENASDFPEHGRGVTRKIPVFWSLFRSD